MKKFYFLTGLVLMLVVIQLSLSSINCVADSDEEKVEGITRNLISDIYNHNINGILGIIPDDGLMDADLRITKEKIKGDLGNTDSHLYEYLYKPLSGEDIILCKEKFNNELYA